MKKIVACILLTFSIAVSYCQDAAQLHETGRTFMIQGDYANAIIVLNKALSLQPSNIDIAKDLSLNYYFSNNTKKAMETMKPLLDREDADDKCYQIAGDILLANDDPKECEKLYKKGIKKFPTSGSLYNELGKLMWAQKSYEAIKIWEKGIEVAPSFSISWAREVILGFGELLPMTPAFIITSLICLSSSSRSVIISIRALGLNSNNHLANSTIKILLPLPCVCQITPPSLF
jgi:tetratricopeptide (TPR) repeat protein